MLITPLSIFSLFIDVLLRVHDAVADVIFIDGFAAFSPDAIPIRCFKCRCATMLAVYDDAGYAIAAGSSF